MHMLNLFYIFSVPQAPVAVTYKLPQTTYPEHAHDVDEIVVVTAGKGIHTINGNQFEAKRGDVFYIRAYDRHQFDNVDDLHLFNILCRCTNRPEQTILPQYSYLQNPPSHWELKQEMLKRVEGSIIPELDAQCQIRDKATPSMINLLFTQALAHLWQGRLPHPSQGKNAPIKQIIIELMTYLNDRFSEDISLNELAQRHALSERTLNRQFKEYTGLSPMHYLAQVRLNKAIEMLRHSEIPITELAFHCGFNDSNYFSDTFKKKFGIPPSQFKKNYGLITH